MTAEQHIVVLGQSAARRYLVAHSNLHGGAIVHSRCIVLQVPRAPRCPPVEVWRTRSSGLVPSLNRLASAWTSRTRRDATAPSVSKVFCALCTCMCVSMFVSMFVCVCSRLHVHACTCMCAPMGMWMYVAGMFLSVCKRTSVCMCMFVCAREVLEEPIFFFSLRTAPGDRPRVPPTANP